MSDETGHYDGTAADEGAFDDRIRRSLAGLGAGAAGIANPSTGAHIRRRAGRRRQALAAGALSAAVLVGGGAVAVSNVLDRPGDGTIVLPGDTPSAPTTDTPTAPSAPPPSSSATSAPTGAPTTSAPPSSEPPPPDPPPTEIPPGFTLPHEGEQSDDVDVTDWETVEGLSTAWDMKVCDVSLYAGDESRTDFRKVSRSGPEFYDSHSLAVYGDAEVAVGVMAAMRTAIAGCIDQPVGESFLSWDLRAVDVGGEAFVAVSTVRDAAGNPQFGGSHFAAVRLGTAVYLINAAGESFPSVDDGVSDALVQSLEDFVPKMCVFTVAGC